MLRTMPRTTDETGSDMYDPERIFVMIPRTPGSEPMEMGCRWHSYWFLHDGEQDIQMDRRKPEK
ncbi:MAG: hypothetical protein IJW67_08885 [Blautia sp.]|nr:hypothetical protein [Blautia sp.]